MRKGRGCFIGGTILILAAVSLSVYYVCDDLLSGKEAENVLEQLEIEIPSDPIPLAGRIVNDEEAESEETETEEIEYPDYVLNPGIEMPVTMINGVYYIGKISFPTIGVELPVCENWSYDNLRIGPCRYAGSVYLDNMVICAHNNYVHFGNLNYLGYGDRVVFEDIDGNVFNYRVNEIEILKDNAIWEMTNGEWDLTMFTCTLGGEKRVTVRCERV